MSRMGTVVVILEQEIMLRCDGRGSSCIWFFGESGMRDDPVALLRRCSSGSLRCR